MRVSLLLMTYRGSKVVGHQKKIIFNDAKNFRCIFRQWTEELFSETASGKFLVTLNFKGTNWQFLCVDESCLNPLN